MSILAAMPIKELEDMTRVTTVEKVVLKHYPGTTSGEISAIGKKCAQEYRNYSQGTDPDKVNSITLSTMDKEKPKMIGVNHYPVADEQWILGIAKTYFEDKKRKIKESEDKGPKNRTRKQLTRSF